MQSVVDRVRAFEGQATLVEAAQVDDLTTQEVVHQARAARQTEYTALANSSRELLDHVHSVRYAPQLNADAGPRYPLSRHRVFASSSAGGWCNRKCCRFLH